LGFAKLLLLMLEFCSSYATHFDKTEDGLLNPIGSKLLMIESLIQNKQYVQN